MRNSFGTASLFSVSCNILSGPLKKKIDLFARCEALNRASSKTGAIDGIAESVSSFIKFGSLLKVNIASE